MGMYRYVREKWKKPKEEIPELWKERLQKWRNEPAVKRIERPTRLDRARNCGYKSKNGITVARVRIKRGKTKRPEPSGGRRTKRSGSYHTRTKSKQRVAEERTGKKFPNMRVLNSYWVAEDGRYKWFEVVLVDPESPDIKNDSDLNWICDPEEKNRAERGKTAAAKNS